MLPSGCLKVSVDEIADQSTQGLFESDLICWLPCSLSQTEVLFVSTDLADDVFDNRLCCFGTWGTVWLERSVETCFFNVVVGHDLSG